MSYKINIYIYNTKNESYGVVNERNEGGMRTVCFVYLE
jgi:hypothetical protein